VASFLDPFTAPLRIPEELKRLIADIRTMTEAVAHVPEMAAGLRAVREDVSALRGELRPLPGSIDRLGQGLQDMAKTLDEVLVNIAPMDEDLHAVETAVRAMAPRLTELRDQIDALRTDLGGLPFVRKS